DPFADPIDHRIQLRFLFVDFELVQDLFMCLFAHGDFLFLGEEVDLALSGGGIRGARDDEKRERKGKYGFAHGTTSAESVVQDDSGGRVVKYRFSHCESPSRPGKRTRSVMLA